MEIDAGYGGDKMYKCDHCGEEYCGHVQICISESRSKWQLCGVCMRELMCELINITCVGPGGI